MAPLAMARDQKMPKALELLAQFVPTDVMTKAHELARRIEVEEYVRNYIARRAPLVLVSSLGAMALSFFVVVKTLNVVRLLLVAFAQWSPMPTTILVFGAALWVASVTALVSLLLWRLQKAAMREHEQEIAIKGSGSGAN
jgi:hypothetical protein